ncbi:MAG: bile acid:sodium symporter [Candidatus Diapherotrites archaeon]
MVHKLIETHFAPLIVFAIVLGIFFPFFSSFEYLVLFLLAVVIFIASLKVDFELFFHYLKNFKYLGSRFVLIKLIFPLIVFFVLSFFSPEFALGGLLLVAVPSGMLNVVLSDILKGNNELSLAFTVLSHLLSFIYIPLLVFIAIQETVSFDYVSLSLTLIQLVLIPVVLAFLVKKFFWNKLEKHSKYFSALVILFIFLIVAIIVSVNRNSFLQFQSFIPIIIFVVLLMFLLMLSGLFLANNRKDKIAFSLSAFHINGALGLFLANAYFSQEVILVMVSVQLVVDVFIAFFKWFSDKFIS